MDRDERGFTLMEIVVILAVVAILAAILAPTVVRYVEDANKGKAQSDVNLIASAVARFYKDTGRFPFSKQGASPSATPDFDLLKGPGTAPTDGSGSAAWGLASATSDTIEAQLQRNSPTGGTPYSTTGRFAWRGPYLDTLTEDPWGSYYVANIGKAQPGQNKQVWIISAGPDRTIQTFFDVSTTGATALSGDDLGARIQ